jgi:hypothetical protein
VPTAEYGRGQAKSLGDLLEEVRKQFQCIQTLQCRENKCYLGYMPVNIVAAPGYEP